MTDTVLWWTTSVNIFSFLFILASLTTFHIQLKWNILLFLVTVFALHKILFITCHCNRECKCYYHWASRSFNKGKCFGINKIIPKMKTEFGMMTMTTRKSATAASQHKINESCIFICHKLFTKHVHRTVYNCTLAQILSQTDQRLSFRTMIYQIHHILFAKTKKMKRKYEEILTTINAYKSRFNDGNFIPFHLWFFFLRFVSVSFFA